MITLTEFIQGPCKQNQSALINAKVIDNCSELIFSYNSPSTLKSKGFVGEYEIELDELKQHCVTLLLSLLEGKCESELKKRMIQALDNFYIVYQRMHSIYEKFVSEDLKLDPKKASLSQVTKHLYKDSFDASIQEGFELYILIKLLLEDEDPEALKKQKEFEMQQPDEEDDDSMHRSLKFYKEFTGSCEVTVKGEFFRVFFPIMPICRFLSSESKQNFLINVPRVSPQHKINGLIDELPNFVDEMEHLEKLSKKKLALTPDKVFRIRDLAYLVSLVINFFILGYYQYLIEDNADGSTSLDVLVNYWVKWILRVLGLTKVAL